MINTVKDYEKLSEQYNKMLEERNTLIDDLSWYRAKVSRLERENGKLERENKTKSHVDDELELAYKNWRAALSMGNSVAEEKLKVDMENLRLREEIERLQNKLME